MTSSPEWTEYARISLVELAAASGYSTADIRELVALGALEPDGEGPDWWFSAACIEHLRNTRRLARDFELPLAGTALLLAYRDRIADLQRRLHALECLLPGGVRD
jgi:chaperone modulatory protein CbpM